MTLDGCTSRGSERGAEGLATSKAQITELEWQSQAPDQEGHQARIPSGCGCGVASREQIHGAPLKASGRFEQMQLGRGCSAVRAPGCWKCGLGSVRSPDTEVTRDARKKTMRGAKLEASWCARNAL